MKIIINIFLAFILVGCGRQGMQIDYYSNGNVRSIEFYKGGQLDSVAFYFDSSGKLESQLNYVNGNLQGYMRTYKNGRLGTESFMKNNKEDGEVRSWYENGQLQSIDFRIDGAFEGKEIHYYENGKLYSEGQNKNGAKTGLWKYYNEKGELIKEEQYDKGRLLE